MKHEKVYAMSFSKIYPLLVAKAEKKGRTKDEVDEIICWLTGYKTGRYFRHLRRFFQKRPQTKSKQKINQRSRMQSSGGGYPRTLNAGNPLSGQINRRAGQRKSYGQNFAKIKENDNAR